MLQKSTLKPTMCIIWVHTPDGCGWTDVKHGASPDTSKVPRCFRHLVPAEDLMHSIYKYTRHTTNDTVRCITVCSPVSGRVNLLLLAAVALATSGKYMTWCLTLMNAIWLNLNQWRFMHKSQDITRKVSRFIQVSVNTYMLWYLHKVFVTLDQCLLETLNLGSIPLHVVCSTRWRDILITTTQVITQLQYTHCSNSTPSSVSPLPHEFPISVFPTSASIWDRPKLVILSTINIILSFSWTFSTVTLCNVCTLPRYMSFTNSPHPPSSHHFYIATFYIAQSALFPLLLLLTALVLHHIL